ncbi:hypothetical protein Q1695_013411 [Nippostrongylus brasiliensis]|nr:hypothetical protein Q1695_013411 [Nippostrongylus brasiliensis]
MTADDFCTAFPYHICFSTDLFIEHVGHIIRRAFPTINAKTNVCDIMEIAHPQMQFSYESVLAFKNSHFIFQLKQTAEMAPALNNVKEPIFLKGDFPPRSQQSGLFFLFVARNNGNGGLKVLKKCSKQ